ncbi:MAG: hypothetical protein AABY32_02975 [Nanoarchaeota archaeon]
MPCDKFIIDKSGKAIIDGKIELDIVEFQSGRYFLDKKIVTTNKILAKLKNYTSDELKKDSAYPIYVMVGHTADKKSGITTRITDSKTLNNIIKEIEESLIK